MSRTDLIERARDAFSARFGHEPEAVGVAPGRVELLGNHTDYNEGFVLTAAIDRGIAIAGCCREAPRVRIASPEMGDALVTFDPETLEKDPTAPWTDYVKGVVEQLNKAGVNVGGFDAVVVSDVPVGGGVSSSAALLVATAQLLLSLYPHTLAVDSMGLAKLCRRAENEFVGAPVGLLDQFSSVFGKAGHALFLDCRSEEWRAVTLPSDRARILIADTRVKHDLAAGGGYRERRQQCEEAALWFAAKEPGAQIRTLRDVTPEMVEAHAGELDPVLEKRARHIVYENKRVRMGGAALESGNVAAFGEVMSNTHESCRRFFENSCEEVDALVEIAEKQPGVYGAKLSGGGWGGCAVILHRPDVTDALSAALTEGYRARFGKDPVLIPTEAAQGAEAFRLV
ncbi:MAG TPA: galactokinase [Armatimonadaceae bacterium]|jgi:galactokinase|nr:galactokinase [Armatimonadaceae bacterium]